MLVQLDCISTVRIATLKLHNLSTTLVNIGDELFYKKAERCLGALRQSLLCNADITLEFTSPIEADDGSITPVGVTGLEVHHRCRNWKML